MAPMRVSLAGDTRIGMDAVSIHAQIVWQPNAIVVFLNRASAQMDGVVTVNPGHKTAFAMQVGPHRDLTS